METRTATTMLKGDEQARFIRFRHKGAHWWIEKIQEYFEAEGRPLMLNGERVERWTLEDNR
jgi:hypothetical protein